MRGEGTVEVVVGIDPGVSGGIAWGYLTGQLLNAIAMPATDSDLAEALRHVLGGVLSEAVVYIEDVHAMPKQGVSSTFKFGKHYGTLCGILTCLRVPIRKVRPQVWQKRLSCMSKGDKNRTKAKAQELFPAFQGRITHAIADAILIYEYGRLDQAMLLPMKEVDQLQQT